jgi:hypothetical protein
MPSSVHVLPRKSADALVFRKLLWQRSSAEAAAVLFFFDVQADLSSVMSACAGTVLSECWTI